MKAAVLRDGEIQVRDNVPTPPMNAAQIQVEPIATGICGSDLSAWQHPVEFLQASRDADMTTYLFNPDADLVLGHELSARVLHVGADVEGYREGELVVALPVALDDSGAARTVGYSTQFPGGLSERVTLAGFGHLPIPDGFSPYLAALTEPLTTGTAAVARSGIEADVGAIVIGCGTVGLGAVAALAERGVSPIVASDPAPSRRSVASALGATQIVDPADADPVALWRDLATNDQELVVYEASAARGMLNRLLYSVPGYTQIYCLGSGMVDETIRPVVGVYKNVDLHFCGGAGKGQDYLAELGLTLARLVDGRIDGRLLVTGVTGLAGAPEAFRLMRPTKPGETAHIKILVCPGLDTGEVLDPSEVGL